MAFGDTYWSFGTIPGITDESEDVQLIINEKNKMSISRLFKSKDTKILEDADVLHSDGSLTSRGSELIIQMFLKKNKKEVVELAKQLIEDK